MKLRFKIQSTTCPGNISYLRIEKGKAQLFNKDYKRIHISAMTTSATELMFGLEDCETEEQVKALIEKHCGKTKEVTAI